MDTLDLDFRLNHDLRYGDIANPWESVREFNPRIAVAGGILIVASACSAGGGGEVAIGENTDPGVLATPTTLATNEVVVLSVEQQISNAVEIEGKSYEKPMPNAIVHYDADIHSLSDFVLLANHNHAVAANLGNPDLADGYLTPEDEARLPEIIDYLSKSEGSYFTTEITDTTEEQTGDGKTIVTATMTTQEVTALGDGWYNHDPHSATVVYVLRETDGKFPEIISLSSVVTD